MSRFTITNFSAEKIRRVDMTIKCSYEDDLRAVKRFLVDVLSDDERVLQLPPPHVAVDQLGDSTVVFVVQPWVKNEYYSSLRADLLEAIKIGFEQNGFHFTSPNHAAAAAPEVSHAKAA